ncbi:serine/threonine-protein kinase [Nocardiopsis halotolerans]|uniref:serine/threonine-protein kinase n=1 Tax=Nocardiopsis halotolerans TaxID=124252 RepID=UPI000348C41D|nr:protein kinase [Nocardiopsis halotolerans]
MTSNGHQSGKPLRAGDPRELDGYRIVSRLGRGGMGTVYLAQDPSDRLVAVKLIHPDLADDESFRLRFAREVESARRVARFSTAGVIDARLEGEPLLIVSEYVPGPNLDEAVREDGPMAGGTLESLAMGVAAALTAIHGSGVVHRDLKPANVLLSPVGPKVIDFGIARALDDTGNAVTRSSQIMGTPSYLAPELILGEQATAAADIFAWGCLVAFAGTGSAPFDAPTVPAVLHRISSAPPCLDGLDPSLHDLVGSALEKDPANRPTSKQLLARLTGQEEPEETEVNRTISTSWAPPGVIPAAGSRDAGAEAREGGPAAHQAPSGPQPAGGVQQGGGPRPGAVTPPDGRSLQARQPPRTPATPPYVQQTWVEGQPGGRGLPPSGAATPYGGHPAQGPGLGQQPPGHHGPSGGYPAQTRQMHGAHPSPPYGQPAFGAHSGPGGPGTPPGPGGPDPSPGHPDGSPKRRGRALVIGAAVGAVALVAAVGGVVLLNGGPKIPENTVPEYNPDFSSDPGWVSDTYEQGESDGYWAEQEGVILALDPTNQPSRGEVVSLDREEELPGSVLVSTSVYAVMGPEQALFGVRCWDNDGEDGRSQYEALVRYDGLGASIRRMSEVEGDNVLADTTEVPGYEPYPLFDASLRGGSGYDADNPLDFDHQSIPTNTVTMACRFSEAGDTMELSLWVNEEHVLTTVDENPLPDDAEDVEDRRRVGFVTRKGPGTQPLAAFFADFSLHRIIEER